jgi:hypothetical protein
MNLRVLCLGLGLLSIAASGDPCNPSGSTSTGTLPKVGQNGAVCEVSINTPCCVSLGGSCNDNNDCCTGNCTGSVAEASFDPSEGGNTCAAPANEGCTAALSSRCNTGQCACASDADCCIGNCVKSLIPGTSGTRCCLETGQPCDAPADCCSLTCNDCGQCE